ncbi:DUF4247 domain-containing protein [Alicyclobacillus sp. SO9]|uniref:DUF4247 domain-containing protein n=1 Tax=Alicyclobacillus sp. SO9 TaxID=2665646 RepID=UPI0018E7C60C|nr:DUF4247 domain-containing protein [Alicyclobacillus sp. SO9]QQE76886.1 DUF4247 domain-containing protein [Alicyclobacillus sp. SO9]
MKKFLLPAVLAVVLLVSGCSPHSTISNKFPLVNVVQDNQGNTSKVYEAANETVPQVAQWLKKKNKPKEISKVDAKRMFLLYRSDLVQIEQDPKSPQNSLIEVSSQQFVKDHYDHSFLAGYLTASILDNMFGWHRYRSYPAGMGYDGYVTRSGRLAKNAGNSGGIRIESASTYNSRVRSGGPHAGK